MNQEQVTTENTEEKAAEALRLHMLQDDKTEYNFEEFADFGVGTEKLDV